MAYSGLPTGVRSYCFLAALAVAGVVLHACKLDVSRGSTRIYYRHAKDTKDRPPSRNTTGVAREHVSGTRRCHFGRLWRERPLPDLTYYLPSGPAIISDLTSSMAGRACLIHATSHESHLHTATDWCPIPFDTWADVLLPHIENPQGNDSFFRHLPRDQLRNVSFSLLPPALAPANTPAVPCKYLSPSCYKRTELTVTCPHPSSTTLPGLRCVFTDDVGQATHAHAVVMTTFALTLDFLQFYPNRMKSLLWPTERNFLNQSWILNALGEPASYFPTSADPHILSQFNYSFGQDRKRLDGFDIAYKHNIAQLASVQVDLNAKKQEWTSLNATSPIVYVQSHCGAKSNRDDYVQELMKYIPVDSYGVCLRNRPGEPDDRSNATSYRAALQTKHKLLSAYKFVLAMENSIDYDYVSEKLYDVWESGSVPLYFGAPNADDYSLGPKSLINISHIKPVELADLVERLDKDDTEYLSYHLWRNASLDDLTKNTPLGKLMSFANSAPFSCDMCVLAHASKRFREGGSS